VIHLWCLTQIFWIKTCFTVSILRTNHNFHAKINGNFVRACVKHIFPNFKSHLHMFMKYTCLSKNLGWENVWQIYLSEWTETSWIKCQKTQKQWKSKNKNNQFCIHLMVFSKFELKLNQSQFEYITLHMVLKIGYFCSLTFIVSEFFG
jgi:hypothetical protein